MLRRAFASLVVLVLVFGAAGLGMSRVEAASLSALLISTSGNGTLTMTPGEVKEVTVTFQNTGASTWKNDGAGYISLYTYEPKYRASTFDPGTWLSPSQVKRIREASVAPQGTASLVFQLHAPTTEGSYQETFALASEDTAWISGGEFTLNITVAEAAAASAGEVLGSTDGLAASLVLQSANKVKITAGKSVIVTAGFQNTGTKTWSTYGLKTPDVAAASTQLSFAHPSWSGSQLTYAEAVAVDPGETAYATFSLTGPSTNGTHTAQFQFTANGESVPDAFITIPVEVTGGAAEVIDAAENENAVDENLIDEPIIRVGFMTIDDETENETVITSYESVYELRDIQGNLLAEMTTGQEVTAYFDGSRYVFDRGRGAEYSSYGLRFVPKTDYAVMTITNFDRRVTRGSSYADNTARGVLEVRHNTAEDRVWLINELPIEYYLRGLAETSNTSHIEFQKALITAARTYAFYHWTHYTKHDEEYYHVDAYYDQVYKGYGQEERTPNLTTAVEATRGQIVTYDKGSGPETAITAYFSRSDGRTRDWSEVWGGSVPWSVSVAVPCDEGKTLWGHGVGMSASGALCMAEEGMLWDDILTYFYTGIVLDQRWK